jgi:hypothetical protein
MAKANFPQNAAFLGDWEFKIKHKNAQNFRSLTDSELGNTYLVLAFNATPQP